MAKILGLDLGTNSIGWAVVELIDGSFRLIAKGVHIFQRGYGDEHQDVSRASERTRVRSARKLIYRRKGRKIDLLRLLGSEYHPFIDDELTEWHKNRKYPIRTEIQEWFKLNPYELRNNAIEGRKLSRQELGRIFYHYTQRRGFKSNKKDISSYSNDEKGVKKNLPKDVQYHEEYLSEFGETPKSKVLYERHKNAERIRNTSEKNKISRITLQEDFLQICKKQVLLDEFTEDVRKIIFDARPLKSQKGNVGKCVFEKNKPRCPISSVEFEEYRMYSFINNIKIKRKNEDKKEFRSLYEQNDIDNAVELIIPLFYRQKPSFKFEDIHRKLDKAGLYDFNYKDIMTVSGCPLSAHLKSVFGDNWKSIRFDNGKNKNGEDKYIELKDIWHMLFDHYMQDKDDEPLIQIAQTKLELSKEESEKFIKAPVKQGYSNLSYKAIERILFFLKQGYQTDKAIILAKLPDILAKHNKRDCINQIIEEVEKIFEIYSRRKKRNEIVNACISVFRSDFKNAHSNYKLDEFDKEIVVQKIISIYGNTTWSNYSLDEQTAIIRDVENAFENQLRSGNIGGTYKKSMSIKQHVESFLIEEIGIDKNTAAKLYHPSAIDFYPIVEPDVNGKRLLGSPLKDSIKNPLFMRSMCELRKVVNELINTDFYDDRLQCMEPLIDSETLIVIETGRDVNDYNMRKAIDRYQNERETENEFYESILIEFFKETNKNRIPSEDDKRKLKFWVEQHESVEESEDFYNKLESHTYQYTKSADRIKLPKDAIEKYRLWKEQNGICIYTKNQISISDLFDDNKIDFEHTIPLSKSFDNSLENKTISEAYFNRYIKKNKIPYELDKEYINNVSGFIIRWEKKIEEIEERIENLKRKAKNLQDKESKNENIQQRHYLRMHLKYWQKKVNNFKAKEVTDGFRNRQLVDIGIINKYARLYLKSTFDNVFSVNASFVDDYRALIGYKKNRNNHIHHTVDAIFCACSVEFVRRKPHALRTLEKYYYLKDELQKAILFEEQPNEQTKRLKEELEIVHENLEPWKGFAKQLDELKEEILVSHRYRDKLKKQTKKKIRIRGKIVHRAEKIQKLDDNKIKVVEWKYKTDIYGKKIPVKGRLNDENPDFVLHRFRDDSKILIEVLKSFEECKENENTLVLKGYKYVRNKAGEIVYEKEPRYTWHNDREGSLTTGVRDSLHKEMLYGRVKRPAKTENGEFVKDSINGVLMEDWYVKRIPVESLDANDIKNIVDDGIKARIQKHGFKNVKNNGEIILPAEENLKEMTIKRLRCRQKKGRGFLNAIPLKENSHLSAKHESRVERFGKDYKQMSYVDNDGNYQLGIYSDGRNTRYKFLNNLDASELLVSNGKVVKVQDNEFFSVRGKKIFLELKQVLHQNLYAILLQSKESINDVNWDSPNELMRRLYEIKSFSESDGRANIFCLHNQCADNVSKLDLKIGEFKLGIPVVKYIRFRHTNFNALIEGVDFKLTPLGEIKRLK